MFRNYFPSKDSCELCDWLLSLATIQALILYTETFFMLWAGF